MPRANRYHLPGYVWHVTERCHRKQFLLKFARDRRAWVSWLYQARKRFGLCVLDYTVTSNHVHLLVRDQGRGEIAESMQLIAGRTGQAYNNRRGRRGAFWEDRYHATAVDTGVYLARCVVYIDLNMVRAGMVRHPEQWETGGYHEIRAPRARRRIVDRAALADALGLDGISSLAAVHAQWIAAALARRERARQAQWTESLAVGGRDFVEGVDRELGARSRYRRIEQADGMQVLREVPESYGAAFGAELGPLGLETERSPRGNSG